MLPFMEPIRGLIIHEDGFDSEELDAWVSTLGEIKYVRMTSVTTTYEALMEYEREDRIILMDSRRIRFFPDINEYKSAVTIMGLRPTEVAVLSSSHEFLRNAMRFMAITIMVCKSVTYEIVSEAPDMICSNLDYVGKFLHEEICGYEGERVLNPTMKDTAVGGTLLVSFQCVEGGVFPIVVLGRYYRSKHHMAGLHYYSEAILSNKRAGKNHGNFDLNIAEVYRSAVNMISGWLHGEPVSVCAVPSRPGKENRFRKILENVTEDGLATDVSANFVCVRDYPLQKSTSASERKANVEGAYQYNGSLNGNTIVLLDDISTTGSTIEECVRTLKKAGSKMVIPVVLAVNQRQQSYWNDSVPFVRCPFCSGEMKLRINSRTKMPFYACNTCKKSIRYEAGVQQIKDEINNSILEYEASED